MGSTVRTATKSQQSEPSAAPSLRWRSWPLADEVHWSWLVPAGILCTGAWMRWIGGDWLLAVAGMAALAVVMWQFLIPVTLQISSLGIRRSVLGRMRLVPWSAIRAYQLRSRGAVFFQRSDPSNVDRRLGWFVPYPPDEDEMVVALRLYLPHAVELT